MSSTAFAPTITALVASATRTGRRANRTEYAIWPILAARAEATGGVVIIESAELVATAGVSLDRLGPALRSLSDRGLIEYQSRTGRGARQTIYVRT